MTTPFWLYLGLVLLGALGSLGTLIGITVTFFIEKRDQKLW
jgi:hypothetical protein